MGYISIFKLILGHIFGKQWDIFQIIYVIVMETS